MKQATTYSLRGRGDKDVFGIVVIHFWFVFAPSAIKKTFYLYPKAHKGVKGKWKELDLALTIPSLSASTRIRQRDPLDWADTIFFEIYHLTSGVREVWLATAVGYRNLFFVLTLGFRPPKVAHKSGIWPLLTIFWNAQRMHESARKG